MFEHEWKDGFFICLQLSKMLCLFKIKYIAVFQWHFICWAQISNAMLQNDFPMLCWIKKYIYFCRISFRVWLRLRFCAENVGVGEKIKKIFFFQCYVSAVGWRTLSLTHMGARDWAWAGEQPVARRWCCYSKQIPLNASKCVLCTVGRCQEASPLLCYSIIIFIIITIYLWHSVKITRSLIWHAVDFTASCKLVPCV